MTSGIAAGNVRYSYAQLQGIWEQAGGNAQASAMAAAIAMAESGGNSAAYDLDSNGSIDRGLWQINSVHGAQSTYDVMGNARAAVSISNNGTNWSPWVTYQTGAYRQYLSPNSKPDNSVPINGTNAAGNQPSPSGSTGGVTTVSSQVNCLLPWNWLSCGVGYAVQGAATQEAGIAGPLLGVIVKNILNPFISITGGILGITAGGVLMVFGLYEIFVQTQVGRETQSFMGNAARTGVTAAFPETRPFLARSAGERTAFIAQQSSRERAAASAGRQERGAQLMSARASQRESIRNARDARTTQTRTTRSQSGNTTTYTTTRRRVDPREVAPPPSPPRPKVQLANEARSYRQPPPSSFLG